MTTNGSSASGIVGCRDDKAMNPQKTVSPFVLFALVLLLVNQCHGQSNVVYYGVHSNAISLAFADTNLSESAQSAITADLRICLSEWGKRSELYMRNKGESIGYLYNFKSSPHYPEDISFPREIVSNGVSDLALQIPKALSDAYTNAFAFAAANSNIVAAAYEVVAFVSSTNFPGISSNALPNISCLRMPSRMRTPSQTRSSILPRKSYRTCVTRHIIRQAFSGSHTAPMDQRLPICGCRFPIQAHQQEGAKIGARPRFSGMKTSGGSVSGLIGCRENERRFPSS